MAKKTIEQETAVSDGSQAATKKPFYKSNSFKCVCVLLCVLLISGIFLTIMYGFLEVTAEERKMRALSKIYGKNVAVTAVDYTEEDGTVDNASILEAYKDENGDYLVKAKGKGGFGGTVTCWVLVEFKDGNISRVAKVVIEGSDGETFLSDLKHLDKYGKTPYTDGFIYSPDTGFVTANVTKSSTAINNCVNGSITFLKQVVLGIAANDPFKDFLYADFIDKNKSSFVLNKDDSVTFSLTVNGYGEANAFEVTIVVNKDKTIKSYEIGKNGSTYNFDDNMPANIKDGSLFAGKDLAYFTGVLGEDLAYPAKGEEPEVIKTGATKSNYVCFTAGAFATANYDNAMATKDIFEDFEYTQFINKEGTTFTYNEDGTVTYNIVTTPDNIEVSGFQPQAFTLTIVVNSDKTVKSFEIVKNGSTYGFDDSMPANIKDGSLFTGKDLAYFTGALGDKLDYPAKGEEPEVIKTGATQSNYVCFTACAFAVANYDNCVPQEGGESNE